MSTAEMMDLVAGRFPEYLSTEAPRGFVKADSTGYRSNTQELIADGITVDSDLFKHSFDESFLDAPLPEKRIAASYSFFPHLLTHFKSASLPQPFSLYHGLKAEQISVTPFTVPASIVATQKYEASVDSWFPTAVTSIPQDILDELTTVQDEAREDGYPVPSEELVADVQEFLVQLYQIAPLSYTIYPMERGEIAIDARAESIGSVVLLCHEKDTWCAASLHNKSCRAWTRDRNNPPEPFKRFVRSALATLASSDDR